MWFWFDFFSRQQAAYVLVSFFIDLISSRFGGLTPRSSAEVEENTSASNRILWLTDSFLKSLLNANDEAREWMNVIWAAATTKLHGEKVLRVA